MTQEPDRCRLGQRRDVERVQADPLHGEPRDWFDSQILYRADDLTFGFYLPPLDPPVVRRLTLVVSQRLSNRRDQGKPAQAVPRELCEFDLVVCPVFS